jgi:hypothetical protein
VAHSHPLKLNLDLILLIRSPTQNQWLPTTSRPPRLLAVARTRFRSHRSIIHPPRIPQEAHSAFHTAQAFHEAPPTTLHRLSLGGEVAVTVDPVTVILTTALPTITTAATMVTPDAHIASAPTDTSRTVPVLMYASLFSSSSISADPTLNFSTPHPATTQARHPCAITTHNPWAHAFSTFSVSGAVTALTTNTVGVEPSTSTEIRVSMGSVPIRFRGSGTVPRVCLPFSPSFDTNCRVPLASDHA